MVEARIEITCPGCNKPFLVPADEQGKLADCPNCLGWVDVPELGRSPTTAEVDEAAALRSAREYDRQMAENARQIEQSQRALDKRDQQDAQFDRLLDRMETVISRWERLADQMGHVIERLAGGSGG
jgi:Zn-finger nucleic acid-binding protein